MTPDDVAELLGVPARAFADGVDRATHQHIADYRAAHPWADPMLLEAYEKGFREGVQLFTVTYLATRKI